MKYLLLTWNSNPRPRFISRWMVLYQLSYLVLPDLQKRTAAAQTIRSGSIAQHCHKFGGAHQIFNCRITKSITICLN